MRIQHNIMAMNSYRNYTNNNSALSKNLEKLSSGYKINRAGDDAAGLAISEKMRAQISGLTQAQANAKSGINLVQTAEGALTEVHDMLNRMVTLADQSANGTYDNEVDRANLQKEVAQLKSEIDRIADSSNFNGIKLLDGSLAASGTSASLAEADISKLTGNLAGAVKTVDATKGTYTMNVAYADSANIKENDVFSASFTLKDADGKEQTVTVNLTAAKDSAGKLTKLVGEDGQEYALATDGTAKKDELCNAVVSELQKNSVVKGNFTVANSGDKVAFTAKEGGSQTMEVLSVATSKTSGTTVTNTDNSIVAKKGVDAFESVDLSKATIYDGTNLDKATFEINGEKFVFVDQSLTLDADELAKLKDAGVEHYVQTAASNTVAAADVTAMADKISMETGLKVEQGTVATTNGVTSFTEVSTGTVIGLKANNTSSSTKGGLTLQIGDTSDKFNQLTVSVQDMHVKALGLKGVDISTQDGAAAAVDVIKAAINTVSSVRGDLGATQNRLDHTINNLSVMTENIQDAESTIRDTDIAEEMMAYTKNNILVQSAQAMLAQANQVPQGVLQLLQ